MVTAAPGAYWNTEEPIAEVTSANVDVTVNDASTAQTWEGFGGAFNEMGWNDLSILSQADRDSAIKLRQGARVSMGHAETASPAPNNTISPFGKPTTNAAIIPGRPI